MLTEAIRAARMSCGRRNGRGAGFCGRNAALRLLRRASSGTVTAGLRALPFVLVLTTCSTYASGGTLTCYAVRPGDTAAGLAQRFTGNARNRYQPWFQILNPARAAVIPKARYDSIQTGWHVCVATEMLRHASPQPPSAPPVVLQAGVTQGQTPIDFSFLWWVAPPFAIGSGLLLGWFVSGRYIVDRRASLDLMRGFAVRFVSEFERPLFRRSAADAPVKSRLRFAPARGRLEIMLAPGGGRTYPNLVDHKHNVEYDVERVERVLRLLRYGASINGPLRAEGPWVVIPFHFEPDRQQEGVP